MSITTQNDFELLVAEHFQRHKAELCLAYPTFQRDGFIVTATMAGTGGKVELRCGPAEYHAEIFILTDEDRKRWSLADLLAIDQIRAWALQNRPNLSGRSRLAAEVDVAFSLLAVGLKGVPEFMWLFASA
jgi:hypothetical protein